MCPTVDEYRLGEGRGRKVGVEGRDAEVGIELTVLVLVLPSDKRDCGLRIPVVFVLWLIALGLREVGPDGDGDNGWLGWCSRKADGAVGLDTLRSSLSLAFKGEGESSMMSTHPDVSCAGVLGSSLTASVRFFDRSVRPRSSTEDLVEVEEPAVEEAYEFVVVARTFDLFDTLPMRSRGTRV